MSKLELLQTPIQPERHDLSNGRWYTPVDDYWFKHFGENVPKVYKRSSTTIEGVISKGKGFEMWLGNASTYDSAMEYANKRALIGTMVHDYCERLLRQTPEDDDLQLIPGETKWYDQGSDTLIPITREVVKYVMSFQKFVKDCQVNGAYTTEALEICMFDLAADNEGNQLHPWAGTADWVVRLTNKKGKEERWLIDFKTGNAYTAHQLQLTSYKILFESIFPELPIDGLACLYLKSGWRKEPNYTFKQYKPDVETWNKVVAVSEWQNNNPVPSFPKELPTTFSLNEEEVQEQLKESA